VTTALPGVRGGLRVALDELFDLLRGEPGDRGERHVNRVGARVADGVHVRARRTEKVGDDPELLRGFAHRDVLVLVARRLMRRDDFLRLSHFDGLRQTVARRVHQLDEEIGGATREDRQESVREALRGRRHRRALLCVGLADRDDLRVGGSAREDGRKASSADSYWRPAERTTRRPAHLRERRARGVGRREGRRRRRRPPTRRRQRDDEEKAGQRTRMHRSTC